MNGRYEQKEKQFEGELQMRGNKIRNKLRLPVEAVEMNYKLERCSSSES